MNRPCHEFRAQRGAVAIIVGFSLAVLIFMVALVVDLGFLYTRKTELQNAADAAALAGARELNGTASGIASAVARAVELAAANRVNFGGTVVSITADHVQFGSTPDGTWVSMADAQTAPGDKRFIKVDTGDITHPTWFMRVVIGGLGGIEETATFGRAVAGPDLVDVAPIAACALDLSDCPPGGSGYCGYRKGQSYKLSEINPIAPGTLFWINPVTTDTAECAGSGSATVTLPFLCLGKVAASVAGAPQILTNTGVSTPQLHALDSRFDDYDPQAKCDPGTAPPDSNIKEYRYSSPQVANWMSPKPEDYVSTVHGDKCSEHGPAGNECQAARVGALSSGLMPTDSGGVLWTYVRPEMSSTPGRTVDSAYYPASGTPYSQTSGDLFEAPAHSARSGRRVLTLLIVDCPATGGTCRPATVRTRGRFLMQRKAIRAGDNDIYIEFGGTVPMAGISAEYKLYR